MQKKKKEREDREDERKKKERLLQEAREEEEKKMKDQKEKEIKEKKRQDYLKLLQLLEKKQELLDQEWGVEVIKRAILRWLVCRQAKEYCRHLRHHRKFCGKKKFAYFARYYFSF